MIHQPNPSTYGEYFQRYTKLVADAPLQEVLSQETEDSLAFWEAIAPSDTEQAYAPGKWSLKEMVQHVIDTECIFQYRALCFARQESKSLPGFDHTRYAEASGAQKRNWRDLLEEWRLVRKSTRMLFGSFSEQQLAQGGEANNMKFSVLALGYIVCGHEKHHRQVAQEKYLTS